MHAATMLSDGRILVAGGWKTAVGKTDGTSALASAELYDPASGTFTPTGDMTVPRAFPTATLLPDGRVLIAGGWNGSNAVASAEIYDPASGTFTPTGDLTAAREGNTATLLSDGRVLITGGRDGSGGVLVSAELYQ